MAACGQWVRQVSGLQRQLHCPPFSRRASDNKQAFEYQSEMFHNRKCLMKERKLEEKSTSRKYIKYPNNHLKTGLQVSESLTYARSTLLVGSHVSWVREQPPHLSPPPASAHSGKRAI